MIERKLYTCEFCHTNYADAKDCKACETGHKTKVHIDQMVFKPLRMIKDGFPTNLTIIADDGSVASYLRDY